MKHSRLRDFCRYLSNLSAYDDRLGLVVFENSVRADRCMCIIARRLGATLDVYHGSDAQLFSQLSRQPKRPAVVLLTRPPTGKLRALIATLACMGERIVSLNRTRQGEAAIILACSRQLYSALPWLDPLRRVGCCLHLETEIFN